MQEKREEKRRARVNVRPAVDLYSEGRKFRSSMTRALLEKYLRRLSPAGMIPRAGCAASHYRRPMYERARARARSTLLDGRSRPTVRTTTWCVVPRVYARRRCPYVSQTRRVRSLFFFLIAGPLLELVRQLLTIESSGTRKGPPGEESRCI